MNTVRAIKSDSGEWVLDVLGVPFGGPFNGRDAQGEYFDANTDLWLDRIPTRPIVYFHGLGDASPEVIGKELSHTVKADGVWFRVILDKTSALAKRVWEAAQKGLARASSGAINHLVRPIKPNPNGYIEVWPVGELSLLDMVEGRQPINPYAIAVPAAKATFIKAGLDLPVDLETDIEPDGERVNDQSPSGNERDEGENNETQERTEDKPMSEENMVQIDPEKLSELIGNQVAEAFKAQHELEQAERKAEAEREKEIQDRIDAAVKAERETIEAKLKANNRLPWSSEDAPVVEQFGELRKYDSLNAGEMAVLVGLLNAAGQDVSPAAYKAAAIKAAEDRSPIGEMTRRSMKALGVQFEGEFAIKADEVNYSTLTSYGKEWTTTAYSQQLWENIRHDAMVAPKLPSVEIPQGSNTLDLKLEGTDPVFYRVGEVTSDADTGGLSRPAPTHPSSRLGTASTTVSAVKMGARTRFSGETEEDSLIPWMPQLTRQLSTVGTEYLDHACIDGDTAATASTNINDIGGTPAGTEAFLLFNGFRKYALTNNATDTGALNEDDFLDIADTLGEGGYGADLEKCMFFLDPHTYRKALKLASVKTKDVWTNATLERGRLTEIWGYPLDKTYQMGYIHKYSPHSMTGYHYKFDTAGKIDQDTAANNTKGTILLVRWDQWLLAWKRRMKMSSVYHPEWDGTEVTLNMRVGLVYRDTTYAAAIGYNVTI